ncbi:26312_t:CDS:2, partial [Racocetra persica]
IKVNITDDIVSIDKENFNQLIKLIIQKDLKIETLTNQNNLTIIGSNNLDQNYSFSQQLELLTTVLLKYQQNHNEYLLDPEQFQQMIKSNEPKLKGFFNKITNVLIPKKRLNKNIEKAKKQIVSSGLTNSGINTLSNIELSVYTKTLQRYKKEI